MRGMNRFPKSEMFFLFARPQHTVEEREDGTDAIAECELHSVNALRLMQFKHDE
jgi:hypothetical protein